MASAQSPAECSAWTIVTRTPRVSTVPPLFMPITSAGVSVAPPSQSDISWMHGHAGEVVAAIVSASMSPPLPADPPRWSLWPWVTSSTSQAVTSVTRLVERGLPNQGSTMMRVPARLSISTHAWPYQVNAKPRSVMDRSPPGGSVAES